MKHLNLTEARDLAHELASLLQRANTGASALESLALVPMIGAAARLSADLDSLQIAACESAQPTARAAESLAESIEAMRTMDARILALTGNDSNCERGEIVRARSALAGLVCSAAPVTVASGKPSRADWLAKLAKDGETP